MKNKKLFAILTLVAFMLTMMPVMAFATTSNQVGAWVEDGAAIVGDGSKDNHDVVFGIELPQLETNENVFVFATVAGTNEVYPINTEFTRPSGSTGSQSIGYQVFDSGVEVGMWVIKFHNTEAVELDLKAVLVKDLGTNGFDLTPDYVLNKVDSGEKYTYANVAWDNDNTVKFTANVADDFAVAITEVEKTNATLRANNGVDWVKYQVKVTNNEKAVKGAEVEISANKVGAFVSDSVVTTNARGVATFTVYASKAGSYKITATCEGEKDDETINFVSAALGSVEVADVTGNFAVSTGSVVSNVDFVLTGTDANGNALTAGQLLAELSAAGVREVVFTKVPENSAFDTENAYDFSEIIDITAPISGNPVITYNTNGQLVLRVKADVAGEYGLKVYNPVTGAGVEYVDFTAKKFTKTAKVVISYPATTYNLDAKVPGAYVTKIDANGTKYTTGGGQFSFTGVGVESFVNETGAFTISDDEKFLGKEIVINAVVDDCFATTTLKIADMPAYLQFTDVTTPVGTEVTVPVKSLDLAGNVAALGQDYTITVQNVVTNAPQGAVVSVDDTTLTNGVTNFIEKGNGVIKVASNKPGTVTVNVIVTASKANGEYTYASAGSDALTYAAGKYFVWQNNAYRAATEDEVGNVGGTVEKYTRTEGTDSIFLTGIATVNFGEEATPVQQSATLIIGSNVFVANGGVQTAPVAPAIIDGRTYLPIRAVGQAIGAQVDYADGIITLTLGAQKATMAPGSNVMTVGTQTVTMDAAPYLAGDNTMVPVRYAAQAFGYELGTTTNADGSVATVTIFK